jgi:hypothetical protein
MTAPSKPHSPHTTRLPDLPAGGLSAWLRRTRIALADESGADVSCGECTACCTTSHFVHVRPDETDALAHIPRELLFAAPGLPRRNVLLGYEENGRCPMVTSDGCSIYEHRPLTCRNYDCRVFAAAGIAADQQAITQRTRRWKFAYPAQDDRDRHASVRAAAAFLQAHAGSFPAAAALRDPMHVAILAVKVCEVFAGGDAPGASGVASDGEIVKAVLEAGERFEARRGARLRSSSAHNSA